MKTLPAIFLLLFSIQGKSQETIEELEGMLTGNWIWTKTVIMDRGGGRVVTSDSCHCIRQLFITDNDQIEYTYNDSVQVGDYNVRKVLLPGPPGFYFHSDILFGRIRFTSKDEFIVGALGSCGAIEHYRRETPSMIE